MDGLMFAMIVAGLAIAIVVGVYLAARGSTWHETRSEARLRRHAENVVYLGVCATCGHELAAITHAERGTYLEDLTTRSPHVDHPLDAPRPYEDHPDAV